MHWTFVNACLLVALVHTAVRAQPASTPPTASEPAPAPSIAPPKDLAGVEALRAQVEQVISEAALTTQPAASQPSDEEKPRIDAGAELLKVLGDYAEALRQYEAELRAIEALGSVTTLEQQNADIAQLKSYDEKVQRELRMTRLFDAAAELERWGPEFEKLNARQQAVAARQTQRSKRLREIEDERRHAQEAATAALAALQQTAAASATQPSAEAGGPPTPARSASELGQRTALWRARLARLREEWLAVESVRLIQEQNADVALLPLLTTLSQRLGELVNKLRMAATELEADQIKRELERASNQAEAIYWRVRLAFVEETRRFNEADAAIRLRFPVARSEELARDWVREQASWERFIKSLYRRDGHERVERLNEIKVAIARNKKTLETTLRPLLDQSVRELDRLLGWREAHQARLSALADEADSVQVAATLRDELRGVQSALAETVKRAQAGQPVGDEWIAAVDKFETLVEKLPEGSQMRVNLQSRHAALAARPPDSGAAPLAAAMAEVQALAADIQRLPDAEIAAQVRLLGTDLIANYYPKAEEVIVNVLANEEQLIARLDGAVKRLSEHLAALIRWRDSLYWSTVLVRDMGWFTADFARIRAEVAGLANSLGWQRVRDVEVAPSDADVQLATAPGKRSNLAGNAALPDEAYPVLDQFWVDWRTELAAVPPPRWALSLVALLGSIVGGVWLRRRLLIRRTRLEEQAVAGAKQRESQLLTLSERLGVQWRSLLAGAAVGVLPLGVLVLIVLFVLKLQGRPQETALRGLGYVGLSYLLVLLCRRLFDPGKARFRLLHVSNVVAAHYRFWGQTFIALSAFVLAPVALAHSLDVLEYTREYIFYVYQGIGLVLFFLFARERDLVLRVVGREQTVRHKRLYAVAVLLYPVGLLALLALIVLQVWGYGALTEYVVVNSILTLAAVLAGYAATRVAHALAERVQRWLVTTVPTVATAAPTKVSAADAADDDLDQIVGQARARERSLIVGAIGTLARWAVIAATVVWIASTWGLTLFALQSFMNIRLFGDPEKNTDVMLWRVGAALAALMAAAMVSRSIRAALHSQFYPSRLSIDRGAQAAIDLIVHYTLIVLGVYIGLRAVRIDFGALVVLMGGLGLGVGLGLQPLIIHCTSGLLMLFERHVKVGDVVEVQGRTGEVTRVGIRSTTIRTADGLQLVIPNGEFINQSVVNWTLDDPRSRGRLSVGVDYRTDPQQVKQILLDVARGEPRVLRDPPPEVWFVNFGENSLDFVLACWFASSPLRWEGMLDLRYAISEAFAAAGIEIPFPQRTIRLDSEEPLTVRVVGDENRAKSGRATEDQVTKPPRAPDGSLSPPRGSGS